MPVEEKGVDKETNKQKQGVMKSRQISLCICSSCIEPKNCKSLEQMTRIAYQIAKAACTFNVNEIIVLQKPHGENNELEKTETNKKIDLNGANKHSKERWIRIRCCLRDCFSSL